MLKTFWGILKKTSIVLFVLSVLYAAFVIGATLALIASIVFILLLIYAYFAVK